jgi:polysaccharide pyruvyl transferase WcaK-like protein
MKILHIGAYDRNVGDSIALINARRAWDECLPGIQWSEVDIGDFWHPFITLQDFKKAFVKIDTEFDAILVGGGGLIEYGGYEKSPTRYKLPFNKEILEAIKIPVYFHAVGVNIFRGGIEYSDEAKKSLQETIDYSAGFSVRNDGSYEKLRDWIKLDVSKVDTIADPGMQFLDGYVDKKETVYKPGIQPAFNGSKGINNMRFKSKENIKFLSDYTKSFLLFPHVLKDYNRLEAKPVIDAINFTNNFKHTSQVYNFLELYKLIDFTVAMRGHGQIVSIGMGIPGLYISTQDKVRDFSLLNGFEDYNIDIEEKNWREQLDNKVKKLTEPNSEYLKQWYVIRDIQIDKWNKLTKKFVSKCISKYEMSSLSLGE